MASNRNQFVLVEFLRPLEIQVIKKTRYNKDEMDITPEFIKRVFSKSKIDPKYMDVLTNPKRWTYSGSRSRPTRWILTTTTSCTNTWETWLPTRPL